MSEFGDTYVSLLEVEPRRNAGDYVQTFSHGQPDTDWRKIANCIGALHLFFGPAAESPQAKSIREASAKAVCDTCVVRVDCLEAACENREYGFWGGMSEEDRFVLGAGPTQISPTARRRGIARKQSAAT